MSMLSVADSASKLQQSIANSLEVYLHELREEEIKNAVSRFEERLRETMAKATINVSDYFDVLNNGHLIQIRCKIDGGDGKRY
jgi:hypothetical protein